jgi:hypothetical protein
VKAGWFLEVNKSTDRAYHIGTLLFLQVGNEAREDQFSITFIFVIPTSAMYRGVN